MSKSNEVDLPLGLPQLPELSLNLCFTYLLTLKPTGNTQLARILPYTIRNNSTNLPRLALTLLTDLVVNHDLCYLASRRAFTALDVRSSAQILLKISNILFMHREML
jgi:hypothetical protein